MYRHRSTLVVALLAVLLLAACRSASPTGDALRGVPAGEADRGLDTDTEMSAVDQVDGGYPSKVSVAPGESIAFHISNNNASAYSLNIYREGALRQLMATIPNVSTQTYSCAEKASVGCGWPVAASFTVPIDWPSGVYTVDIPRGSGGRYQMIFFVRERNPGTARILFLTSVNTFHAYNAYGGGSLYDTTVPKLQKVSFDRPYSGSGLGNYTRWESHFVEWAEAAGYSMAYATTYDLEFQPDLLKPYDVVIIAGHSEYWTWDMRQRVKAFVAEGGRFMNLSGNTMWWQVRFEDNGRTMVGYKSRVDDPVKTREGSTSLNWKYPIADTSFLITGLHWPYGGYPGGSGKGYYTVHADHWIFNGTGLTENQSFGKGPTRATSIHDKESDGLAFNCGEDGSSILGPIAGPGTPGNFTILGLTSVTSKVRNMEGVAMMGLYTLPSGGAVFSAGTTGWILGLDQPVVDRITRNIIDRFLAGDFPQEPAAADADVLFRDRFNCTALERNRFATPLPSADAPKLNYVEVVKGEANQLTAACGYRGAGLAMRPSSGSRYIAYLQPDLSGINALYTGVYLNLRDLMLVEGTTIDLFDDYADASLDDPPPVAVLQLGRRNGQLVARYQPVGRDIAWVPVPADHFFFLETHWDKAAGTLSLAIDGQQRAVEALPASPGTLNRVDFGTIAVSGNASGTICLDELVYDDQSYDGPPPADTAPAVVAVSPADGAEHVAAAAQLQVQFSEAVTLASDWFDITCDASGHHAAAAEGGPTTYTLTPVLPFSHGEQCTVTLRAAAVHDADADDPPDSLAADYSWSFRIAPAAAADGILINEVDSDTPGTDTAEFIELYDGGRGHTDLSGLVVVLWNGSNDAAYHAIDLAGQQTGAGGYFVLGSAALAGVDLPLPDATLQNGPDAVALYAGDGAAFPDGAPLTVAGLRDAVVYGPADEPDGGLLTLLEAGQPALDEAGSGHAATHSLQRCPNGDGGPRRTAGFRAAPPSPGVANPCLLDQAPAVSAVFPLADAIDVPLTVSIVMTFSEPVTFSGRWFGLTCGGQEQAVTTLPGEQQATVVPSAPLPAGAQCVAVIAAGGIADQDGDDPPDTLAADYTWQFQTLPAPPSLVVGFTSNSPVWIDEPVVFTNTTTAPVVPTYLWDFDDGTGSTLANPGHLYTTPGTYTVTLTATTSRVATFSAQVVVRPRFTYAPLIMGQH